MKLLAVAGLAVFFVLAGIGGAAAQDPSEGEAVYNTACASCHQPGGVGLEGTFPPLAGNPNAADGAYVESVIREGLSGPIVVMGQTYDGVMPPISQLDDAEVAAVVTYVETIAGEESGPPPDVAPAPEAAAGDAVRGRKLFDGSAGMAEGGAACVACHSAGSIGFRGGSGLGPDLTDVFDRFGGAAGLSAWLANPTSLTMQPIFADHPLTEDEITDLTAFFDEVRNESPEGGVDQLALAGVAGLVVLLVFMAVVLRGPQRTYVDRLRRRR